MNEDMNEEQTLKALRAEEIECAHCGEVPDGTITIKTDTHDRYHRICNECAHKILGWL